VILLIQIHARRDTGSAIEKADVRPAFLVGDDVDALSIPIVPSPWRRVKPQAHHAILSEGQTKTLGSPWVVNAHANATRVPWPIEVAEDDPRSTIRIFDNQLAYTESVSPLLCLRTRDYSENNGNNSCTRRRRLRIFVSWLALEPGSL
jgi:hypothetical protein